MNLLDPKAICLDREIRLPQVDKMFGIEKPKPNRKQRRKQGSSYMRSLKHTTKKLERKNKRDAQ